MAVTMAERRYNGSHVAPRWHHRLVDALHARRDCGWFYWTWWQDWRMRRDLGE